jgi:hypothetical protein
MTLCWRVSRAASPGTFCACGDEWPPSSLPPLLDRTPPVKVPAVSSTPSAYLRDSAVRVVKTSSRPCHFMRPRSCGSSGTARSPISLVSLLRNLSLAVSVASVAAVTVSLVCTVHSVTRLDSVHRSFCPCFFGCTVQVTVKRRWSACRLECRVKD